MREQMNIASRGNGELGLMRLTYWQLTLSVCFTYSGYQYSMYIDRMRETKN